jgi:hypothetical protein
MIHRRTLACEARIIRTIGYINAKEDISVNHWAMSWHDSHNNNGMTATGFAISSSTAVNIYLLNSTIYNEMWPLPMFLPETRLITCWQMKAMLISEAWRAIEARIAMQTKQPMAVKLQEIYIFPGGGGGVINCETKEFMKRHCHLGKLMRGGAGSKGGDWSEAKTRKNLCSNEEHRTVIQETNKGGLKKRFREELIVCCCELSSNVNNYANRWKEEWCLQGCYAVWLL